MLSADMFLPLGAMHALQWAAGDVVRPRPGVEFLRNEGPDGVRLLMSEERDRPEAPFK